MDTGQPGVNPAQLTESYRESDRFVWNENSTKQLWDQAQNAPSEPQKLKGRDIVSPPPPIGSDES